MPPLLEARGGDHDDSSRDDEEEPEEERTDDETDDDDDTESDDRVTVLSGTRFGQEARLIPLQIQHVKEEACGNGNHTT